MHALRKTCFSLLIALLFICSCGKKSHNSVSCDARAFIVDGERIQIVAAPLPYFRIPAELWSDRILKAKRGGINTIEVAVPWNIHEPEKDVFSFKGDNDLERFITLCEQAGMYIILRPAPFIYANTDFIDYPAWLRSKKGQTVTVDDPIFIEKLKHFYTILYPFIQKHLWNKGGNIILIQVENTATPVMGDKNKLEQQIIKWWRDIKTGLPLVYSIPGAPEFRQCVELKKKKNPGPDLQKNIPIIPPLGVEKSLLQYTTWGSAGQLNLSDCDVTRILKILSLGGAEINYSCYHGGSNFGYNTLYLQTTVNDNQSAVYEGGGFTDNYFQFKSINQFAGTFASFFLNDHPVYPDNYQVNDSLTLRVRENEASRILLLENKYSRTITSPVNVNKENLGDITIPPNSMVPVIINYVVDKTGTINYSTAFIQNIFTGMDGKSYILLSGTPGTTGRIKLTGEFKSKDFDIAFSPENKVISFKFEQFVVLVANERLAGRVQIMNIRKGQIAVFGPELVRSWKVTGDKIKLEADITPQCQQVTFYGDGKGGITIPVQSQERRNELPQPGNWTFREETPVWDKEYDDSDWLPLNDPFSMLLLSDTPEGYGWYRARFDSPGKGRTVLSFNNITDRITVWLNGERIGSSLTVPLNQSGKVPVSFIVQVKKGRNDITVLVNNLGLHKPAWQNTSFNMPEDKGLLGPVYVGIKAQPITEWRYKSSLAGEGEQWMREVKAFKAIKKYKAKNNPVWFATNFKIDNDLYKSIPPLRINMNTMSKGTVWINGRMLGRHWNIGQQDILYIPESWLEKKNTLVIFDEDGNSPENVRLLWDGDNNLNPTSITYSYK